MTVVDLTAVFEARRRFTARQRQAPATQHYQLAYLRGLTAEELTLRLLGTGLRVVDSYGAIVIERDSGPEDAA